MKPQVITETPTKEQLENLMAGDIVPNCFGKLRPITKIFGRGTDKNGLYYVCFYTQFSEGSTISGSLKEGEEIITLNPIQY